ISTPAGNRAPTAVISPPSCLGLSCNVSGATSVDPDTGDVLTYAWTFGDGATSTSASPSRTYAAAGTYTITLTVKDGWGATASATTTVTVP
ncbi:MAG: PKD domain-containing protein, partial [Dermatophilaceae bacterium]